jgi:hypothetical protein
VRFVEIGDAVNQFVRAQIEDFNRSVLLGGEEQPMTGKVHGEVVEIAVLELRKRNRLLKLEWLRSLQTDVNRKKQAAGQDYEALLSQWMVSHTPAQASQLGPGLPCAMKKDPVRTQP